MVPVMSLWLPILLSAVVVFVVSSILHMVLPYHRSDFKGVPKEADVMDALRPFAIPPGDYHMPHTANPTDMKDPAFIENLNKGPVVLMTVMPNGVPAMGPQLMMWFLYSVLISGVAAYVGSRALVNVSADYLAVFRFVGTTAFAGYSLALLQNSIWYKRNWSATLKSMFDGLVYASLTAGVFGWLWPM